MLLVNKTVSDVIHPYGSALSLLQETSSSDLWSKGYAAWFPLWGLQTPGGMAISAFSLLRIFLEIIKGKLPLGGHRSGEYAAWPGNSSFMQRKCSPFFRADAVPGRSLSLVTTVQAGFQLLSPLSTSTARPTRRPLSTAARGVWQGMSACLKLLAWAGASF